MCPFRQPAFSCLLQHACLAGPSRTGLSDIRAVKATLPHVLSGDSLNSSVSAGDSVTGHADDGNTTEKLSSADADPMASASVSGAASFVCLGSAVEVDTPGGAPVDEGASAVVPAVSSAPCSADAAVDDVESAVDSTASDTPSPAVTSVQPVVALPTNVRPTSDVEAVAATPKLHFKFLSTIFAVRSNRLIFLQALPGA